MRGFRSWADGDLQFSGAEPPLWQIVLDRIAADIAIVWRWIRYGELP